MLPPAAASATTWKRPGWLVMTSMVWDPMDPVDPAITTWRITTASGG
jgi:hypothetical protein